MWIDRSNSCMTGYTEVELRIEISNFLFAVLNRPISLNRMSEVRSGVFLDSE
jgi:hypothetical protein